MISNLIDCHTHTMYSPDGKDSPQKMVERACELGLTAYAITDHCECNTWNVAEDYQNRNVSEMSSEELEMYNCGDFHTKSMRALDEIMDKYNGKTILIRGIELGQPMQALDIAEEICSEKYLDFIIGSLHNNFEKKDFYFYDYNKMTDFQIRKMLDDYFTEMLEMCRVVDFDVLGHLTYPLRYICGECGVSVELKRYKDIISEIFKCLIENGKGIEINTSGLWQKYGRTFPNVDYVKLYKELGGEIISLGSDTHCVSNLGKGIRDGAEIALNVGFKYLTYFKNRKPVFVKM